MPIYEYKCEECSCKFDLKQNFDAEPVAACSKCGGKSKRIFQCVPVIFKGSGFYITDNRKNNGDGEAPKKRPSTETDKAHEGSKESQASKDPGASKKPETSKESGVSKEPAASLAKETSGVSSK